MTRLRWTTYDDRRARWGVARVRFVALVVAFTVTAAGALAASSNSGRADTVAPSPSADLSLLEQQHRAELAAIEQSYASMTGRIAADYQQNLTAADARLQRALAALDDAVGVAAAARAAALAADLDAVAARRTQQAAQVHASFDRDELAINAFFGDLLASLGTADKIPSSTLDAAKKALEARRSTEVSALDTAQKAENAALAAQVQDAVGVLDQDAARIDAANQATRSAIDAALDSGRKTVTAGTAIALRQVDDDTAQLKARYAQELIDLDAVHKAQQAAAAVEPKAVRDALAQRQHTERDDLAARQNDELDAQAALRKTVQDDAATAMSALQTQHDADRAGADAAYKEAKDANALQRAAVVADGATRTKSLNDSHDAAMTALKYTYAAAITGLSKGRAGVQEGWTARLARLADDESKAAAALDGSAQVETTSVRARYDRQADAAQRQLTQDQRAARRVAELERGGLDRDRKRSLLEARLDYQRRVRLADSDYYTLKIRAVAFLQDPSGFATVSAAFDPATDPGSVYNVARRIGASELPADVTGQGVDVALIDTGVVDVPGLAEADVEIGPDFSFEDAVPELRGKDTMGHGTHLAGIIAGRDAAWATGDHQRRPDRFLGVAPGARIISVKAGAADGAVDVSQIIAAIDWVIANQHTDGRNIRVLNLSFGTDGIQDYRLDPLAYAVERAWRAGIVVVVAGGNDGWAASRLTNPAQDPFVIAVGSSQALNGNESVPSGYSNGTQDGRGVDLAAPGRSIVSLRNPGSASDAVNQGGRTGERFVRASGTSQAAAVTSGAVALLLSARPELSPDQVKRVLRDSATRDVDDSALVGAGYLRVDRAVKKAVGAATQTWTASDGSGSLDGSRGSVRVVRDGIVLEGDVDIFGNTWSGAKWSTDSWSGAKWSTGDWSGAKWSGAKWSTDMWSGGSWTGAKWSTGSWTGAKWSGAKWSSDTWSGAKWSGAKWSAGGWFGAGWGDGPSQSSEVGAEPVSPEAVAAASG
jgi:serine protease AprX